jgi:multiple sugar transport system permease protein
LSGRPGPVGSTTSSGRLGERFLTRFPPGRVAIVALLAAISAATIYPMLFMLFTALKGRREYLFNRYGPPARPTLVNFYNALTFGKMGRYAVNSLIVTTMAVVLAWIVCSLAAYALSQLRFRGRRAVFLCILGSMMIAPQVIVVPLYTMLVGMNLVNSHLGLALVYVTLGIPFGTYLLTSYFRAIPRELVEAAQIDGANHLQTLWHVVVPVSRPALVTLGIFNFLWMWNELLFSLLILQDDSVRTLMVGVANLRGQYTTNIPLLSAGLFIAAVPVLLVFFVFQSRLAKGMTAGAVK